MAVVAKAAEKLWWVPDEAEVWTVASQSGDQLPNGCVNFLIHKSQKIVSHPLEKCLPATKSVDSPEDLVFLPEVNQATILTCIRARFVERKIYTSIGLVMMTLNPFEVIPGLYGKNMIKKYENPMLRNPNSHVYMVPSRAYHNMCTTGLNQSILISGESGAGKTEGAKHCLAFLTEVANVRVAQKMERSLKSVFLDINDQSVIASNASIANLHSVAEIADRVIAASPILEAFGNAKTLRNPNSSRFGKWMVLNFDQQNVIHSSSIVSYLLEKSRVTSRDPQERNYHVFYQILRGLNSDQLQEWKIQPQTSSYRYLTAAGGQEAADLQDARVFKQTEEAFSRMGFTHEESFHFFKLVVAILQLGNIEFGSLQDGEGSEIRNPELVNEIAKKLSVNETTLLFACCNRCIESGKSRKSVIQVQLTVQKAMETRDSLARSIYEKLFTEIISLINMKSNSRGSTADSSSSDRCIGLLDIFGFEIFAENSFEQLCINYCNEMLQHHFDYVIFTAEKNLYMQERIVCETIEFRENAEVIRDIESIFKALDEESRVPKGSSKQWFDKMKKSFKTTNMVFPTRRKGDIFVVKHYAGDVEYNPILFLDKNVETVTNDLVATMAVSEDTIINKLFAKPVEEATPSSSTSAAVPGGGSDRPGLLSRTTSFAVGSEGTPGRKSGASSMLANKSLSWKFIQQLSSLMTMLKKTESHFIRCIKSNDACISQRFDPALVYKQLIYSGVFEVVKIQQSGLPCRVPHRECISRFKCLAPSRLRWTISSPSELISILTKLGFDLKQSKVGQNLTFFKSYEQKQLESRRDDLLNKSSSIVSCWLQRLYYRAAFKGVIINYRLFHKANEDLNTIQATPAFLKYSEYVHALHQLCRKQVLQHTVEHMQHELAYLDRRCDLINDARERLENKTKDGIKSLEEVLNTAMELEITFHPVIKQCKITSQEYYRAIEFVDIVHYSDPGSDSNHYTTKVLAHTSRLETLKSEQIIEGVHLLEVFCNVVDDANVALTYAKVHLQRVEQDLEYVVKPLEALLTQASLRYDESAGIMLQIDESDGPNAFNHMKELLHSHSGRVFSSQDVTNLYQDCIDFVTLVEDYIFVGDANGADELIQIIASKRTVCPAMAIQFGHFQRWIQIQLSPDALRLLLTESFIPCDNKYETMVEFSKIKELISHLQTLTQPSPEVEAVIAAGCWIIELRRGYLSQDWLRLEEIITHADQDGIENGVFDEFPDCITELNNAQWQVIYHGFMSDVLAVIKESIFRSIPLNSDSWNLLIADINDDLAMIHEVKSFVNEDTAPQLSHLIPLLEEILHVRTLMFAKEVVLAEKIIKTIRSTFTAIIAEFELTEHVEGELQACEVLMKKNELENNLLVALRYQCAQPYTCSNNNEQVPYSQICDLSKAVVELERALQQLALFPSSSSSSSSSSSTANAIAEEAKYDSQLEAKISLAKDILNGRQRLTLPDTDPTIDWKEHILEMEKVKEKALKQQADSTAIDDSSEDKARFELTLIEEFFDEFDVFIYELHRRYIVQGLLKILSEAAIIGEIDVNVHVTEITLTQQSFAFNLLMQSMKKYSPPQLHSYAANLQCLAQFTKSMLKLRRKIFDKLWQFDELEYDMAVLRKLSHGSGLMLTSVQGELKKIHDEIMARIYIAQLRQMIEMIQIKHNDTSSAIEVDLTPLTNAMKAVEALRGSISQKLCKLAKNIINIIEVLLQNHSDRIDEGKITECSKQLLDLQLDPTNVDAVFEIVRVHNFLKNIRFALTSKHAVDNSNPEAILQDITHVRESIKSLPIRYVPWLRAAYLFCDVSCSLADQGWVRLVETTRKLDEFITTKLNPLVELERTEMKAFTNWNDVMQFMEIITNQKVKGFQIALERKRLQDQNEEQEKALSLSPTEALKAQIRNDEFLSNPYGLGQLKKAGYSDAKLSKLNFDARLFWAHDFDVSLLRRKAGFTPKQLLQAGYTVSELFHGSYTVQDLYASGITLEQIGLHAADLLRSGITLSDVVNGLILQPGELQQLESDPKKLLACGLTLKDLIDAGFNMTELRGAGFSAAALYHAGFDRVESFLDAGYDLRHISGIFSLYELKNTGITYRELKLCGYNLEELLHVGFVEEAEQEILVMLYRAMNGDRWKIKLHWLNTGFPVSQWHGISTERDEHGKLRVTGISLVDNNMKGSIPTELCLLTALKRLLISANLIVNKIPEKLLQFIADNNVITDLVVANISRGGGSGSSVSSGHGPSSLAATAAGASGIIPLLPPSSSRSHSKTEAGMAAAAGIAMLGGTDHAPAPPRAHINVDSSSMSIVGNSSSKKMTAAQVILQQRQILVELYHSLHGSGWRQKGNWCTEAPLSQWHGVTVSSVGFVTEITLSSNNIKGVLPMAIGQLRSLRVLDLRLNQIHCVLPLSLGQCSSLRRIALNSNKLFGSIPDSLGNLVHLELLDLRSNLLDGQVPRSLAELRAIKYVGVSSNFIGEAEVRQLKAMLPAAKIA